MLTVLLTTLVPASMVKEEDVPWTFESLLRVSGLACDCQWVPVMGDYGNVCDNLLVELIEFLCHVCLSLALFLCIHAGSNR